MRVTLLMMALLGVAACERYTEQTSPCFGKTGEPVVSRNAMTPLSFSSTSPDPAKDCVFEPVNGS
ncbi:hypothetical protein [Leisingera caerulea]|uniref:hypothetical protein n=1 Tax=Leisingera caerulea TaxID=506591 RepID=UPI0021A7E7E8|nr:hypothetical protein [Leisingera caerulea]UWQ86300.1 hypothetical protein K3726_22230 [Leisingera caerulea]